VELQHERDRLQLLLDVTNQVVSNLELRDLLRAIAGPTRKSLRGSGTLQYKQTSQQSKSLGYILRPKWRPLAYTLVLNRGGRILTAVGPGDGLCAQTVSRYGWGKALFGWWSIGLGLDRPSVELGRATMYLTNPPFYPNSFFAP